MKNKVLVDAVVEIDMRVDKWHREAVDNYAKRLEREAKDFEEFLRDHRSRDVYSFTVVRKYEEICSFCKRGWEELDDGEPVCCQAAIDEWEGERVNRE